MVVPDILPGLLGIDVARVEVLADRITVHAASTAPAAACPRCGTRSHRVRSRYARTLADKPLGGRPLYLHVTVRRFACTHHTCSRTIFAEPLDHLAAPHARTTTDLADAHTAIGFTAGGEPGSRLTDALAMPTSPDTLLRRIKAAAADPGPPPRYVGVDDWAYKKGQHYGTIVIDLERGRVLDLLPGRDGEALAAWLRKNPQVEVITRDRWAAYAKAATEAAPQASQVADRWHLLKNLREAVEGLLAQMSPEIQAAATPEPPAPEEPTATPEPTTTTPEPVTTTVASPPVTSPAREARRQTRRDRRQRVLDLKAEGWSARRIAAHLHLSRATVSRLLHRPDRPHGNAGRRGRRSWMRTGRTSTPGCPPATPTRPTCSAY